MYRILLCCNAGMSTSMVVKKMQQAAKDSGIDVEIKAVGLEGFSDEIFNYDCCLIGPQIKFRLDELKKVAEPMNKPVVVINSMDYGLMNGEKILRDALKLI
ncbi:PTS sugar transporter subunit IIB [Pectobacterium sp. A5351]|uniref:PTS sugar transporter subunit IIB n=1 Tax=Pectobacterium sp. A5351 TaxID=2914983 RepID=UPI0023305712|nr:PTS sugar transporter subunit IIB [Pectobacterium sp. A5351]WCG81495.1 PTS sugar transporter subunit IIB [Pectobacterium sp. A5351]